MLYVGFQHPKLNDIQQLKWGKICKEIITSLPRNSKYTLPPMREGHEKTE
jgi:hypothetical protein